MVKNHAHHILIQIFIESQGIKDLMTVHPCSKHQMTKKKNK